jgi:broad specificity phosphatase PhoE
MIREWRGADVLWARHGRSVANLTKTLSYRVFDGDLTDVGRRQAQDLAERLVASRDRIGRLLQHQVLHDCRIRRSPEMAARIIARCAESASA